MRRLVGCLSVGLVMVIWAASSVAQDPPGDPAFASYWEDVHAAQQEQLKICLSRKAALPNGDPDVHSLLLTPADNPWLPPLDTPIQQFTSPFGWTWRPDPTLNAWLATSPNPFPLNQELCFSHPVTRRLATGEVEKIIAEDANRRDVYFFTSQQVVPKAKRGDLPLVYTLPQQDVTATFTSPSSACGLARNFTTGLRIGVKNNLGTIVEPQTGDTVKGTVNPKTYTFRFTGSTEVYAGGINRLLFWASYGYTRTFGGQPCTAGYLARINLSKPATIAPACNQPKIVAPRTVFVQSGPFRIRLGATCAGQPVAGVKGTATLRFGNDVRRLGPFTTRPRPEPMRFRALTPQELERMRSGKAVLELRTSRQRGLGRARRGYVCSLARVCR